MLQGVQPKGCQHACLVTAEHAEDPAFLLEAVKLSGSGIREGASLSVIGMSWLTLFKK